MQKHVFTIALLSIAATAQTAPQQKPADQPEQPSIADVVRQLQTQKAGTPARREYTNETLPRSGAITVIGNARSDDKADKAANTKDMDKAKSRDGQPRSITADWQAKLDTQAKEIADLEHELDIMQREYRLRVSQFYWDAGSRLRDDKKWSEEEQKYKDDVADRTAKLEAARAKLEDMKEEARKAGVPQNTIE